ncbi:MAG: DUF5050 domain-containing protein [bacterium]|nr:DUF5050 domain-containing protein [bacterium]
MKIRRINYFVVILITLISISCTKNNEMELIAYCYQPKSGPAVKEIYTINADGTENRKISDAPIGVNHHDWSPDGNKIVCVGYADQSTWSIYTFNADDGSGFTRLTDMADVLDNEPVWSPDGSTIAFTRTYSDQNMRNELWIMNADGTDQQSIGIEGYASKWSSDGQRFIYCSNAEGNFDIYTCNTDGTNIDQLTSTPHNEMSPIWSPDGSKVAFHSNKDGDLELYVMNSDGTNEIQLTNNNSGNFLPRWSPDGSTIVFCSGLPGNDHWEVYLIDADGNNLRQLTNTPSVATAICPVFRPRK